MTLCSGGIEGAAVAARLRTLRNDGVGARCFGGAGFTESRHAGEPESLDPEQSLAEALTQGSGGRVTVGGQSRHVIGYMKDFLFRPEQARTPVGVLSGGERARLYL